MTQTMTRTELAKFVGASEETVRKIDAALHLRPDLAEKMASGQMSGDEAYRIAIGDDRVPLFVRISPRARELLDKYAEEWELPLNLTVELMIRQIFGEV